MHHTIVAVDVEGFGGRPGPHQTRVRNELNRVLREAFDHCGLSLDNCEVDDRGDGLRVLLPPDVSADRLVECLPNELAARLRAYNETAHKHSRIRLRLVMHSGEIWADSQGYDGPPLVRAARLLDSRVLRRALRHSNGLLAVITSETFFRDVVKARPAANPRIYRRVWVIEKETRTWARICLPDHLGSLWWLLWVWPFPSRSPGTSAEAVTPSTPSETLPRRRGHRFLWTVSGAVVLLLLAVLGGHTFEPLPPPGCPEPVQLNVNVSPEKARAIRSLAADFEREPEGCKEVSVQVRVAASSSDVATALGRDWSLAEDLRKFGPEPHVYLPDSSWELAAAVQAERNIEGVGVALDDLGSIAYSPLALVREAGSAEQPDTWADVLPLARESSMLRPGLMSSGTGLLATIALYSARLGDRLDREGLYGGNAAATRRGVELAVTAGGESDALLGAVEEGRANAVLVSEKAAVEHLVENREGRREASRELEITYPRDGTFYLDHPFVAVGWPGRPANRARDLAVRDFHRFLTGRNGQAELRRAGFRDLDGDLDPFLGAPEGRPPTVDVDVVDVLTLQRAHHEARKPARVQLLMDVSGAMAEPFPNAGGRRLSAAAEAAMRALDQMGASDQVGLWEVAEGLGGTTDHRVVVPLHEGGAKKVRDALEDLYATDLRARTYEAVRAAVTGLREPRPRTPTSDAVVIIADGTAEENERTGLIRFLREGPRVPVFMIAFDTSACSGAWTEITRDTGGACHEVVVLGDVDEALNSVATALWGRT